MRAIVVDCEEPRSGAVRRLLGLLGYDVADEDVVCTALEAAMRIAKIPPPSLIVSAVDLPGSISGLRVAQMARDAMDDTPVVLLEDAHRPGLSALAADLGAAVLEGRVTLEAMRGSIYRAGDLADDRVPEGLPSITSSLAAAIGMDAPLPAVSGEHGGR